MSEPTETERSLAGEPTSAALRNRIVAGLLYAAARFVPVPLVDDLLRAQTARWMVGMALPAGLAKEAGRPLWEDPTGCAAGCLRGSVSVVLKLALFPVRKILALVLGVRWVSRDLAEMLLLGRVLDHARETGLLDPALGTAETARRSREIRKAFDTAMQGHDVRFLTALLRTAIGPVRAVVRAAVRTLKALRRSRAEEPTVGEREKPVIDASVGRIRRALLGSEAQALLREFDRRILPALDAIGSAGVGLGDPIVESPPPPPAPTA